MENVFKKVMLASQQLSWSVVFLPVLRRRFKLRFGNYAKTLCLCVWVFLGLFLSLFVLFVCFGVLFLFVLFLLMFFFLLLLHLLYDSPHLNQCPTTSEHDYYIKGHGVCCLNVLFNLISFHLV